MMTFLHLFSHSEFRTFSTQYKINDGVGVNGAPNLMCIDFLGHSAVSVISLVLA